MSADFNRKRRTFLRRAGLGALALAAPRWLRAETGRGSRKPSPDFKPDVEIEMVAQAEDAPILSGPRTAVWRYQARVVKGPENAVSQLPDSFLSSLLRFEKGQKVRITLHNRLPEPNIAHWHGLHVPQVMDGHPMYGIAGGESYVYEFEVHNRAGTYHYHAHTHEATDRQVYRGLIGALIVHDEEERSLKLPSGEFDIPIVLTDRSFDGQNQLRYLAFARAGGGDPPGPMGPMHGRMTGFWGDEILVNGRRNFVLSAAARAYRLRVANASNARIYKLAWDDGTPLTVIGTDGGLLEKPVTRPYLMLGPGERVELWADFKGRKIGSELTLKSLPFRGALHGMAGGMMGGPRGMGGMMEHGGMGMGMGRHGMGGMMGGGMMGESALPPGGEYSVLKVRVTREAEDSPKLPDRLTPIERYQRNQAANAANPRRIRLEMRHMQWLLNGREFELLGFAEDEVIRMNTLQLIEFDNGHDGVHMMAMTHPMHIHGQQFQVIERRMNPALQADYDTMRQGFVDEGWKDVVLVAPGEKVTLLKRFDQFTGLFLYHCHNLEHESMGMMRNFNVVG